MITFQKRYACICSFDARDRAIPWGLATVSMPLTARQLHERYGELLSSPPFSEAQSYRVLHRMLSQHSEPIQVTPKTVQVYLSKYRVAAGAVTVDSAEDLEQRFGDGIRHLSLEYKTSFRLCNALREWSTPIVVTDKVAST